MTTRKRWSEVYAEDNPLSLPQAIRKELKACCKDIPSDKIQFLWVMLSDASEASGETMDAECWLNVIDEAAALGARTVVVSLSSPLDARPEVWTLCDWAIATHQMLVGIHLNQPALSDDELARLRKLDPERLCVFVHSDTLEHVKERVGDAFRVIEANGIEDGAPQHHCELPGRMSCVCESGELYTCGLVIGRDGFYLGDVNGNRIDHVLEDSSLPHVVPENTSSASHRCDGCPPLLEERMRKAFEA